MSQLTREVLLFHTQSIVVLPCLWALIWRPAWAGLQLDIQSKLLHKLGEIGFLKASDEKIKWLMHVLELALDYVQGLQSGPRDLQGLHEFGKAAQNLLNGPLENLLGRLE